MAAPEPQPIIDSHIHLWPESMSNEQSHAWMTPGGSLVREHLLAHYYTSAQQNDASKSSVEGVIYVETDVRYDDPNPSIPIDAWAQGPLDEIQFLRKIVEGAYGERDAGMLVGIVAWAPMDQPTAVLEEWLRAAEQVAGDDTWKRVKGFRFLLQSIKQRGKFEGLVLGDEFVENLKLLGRRGFSFDVGVDQRSGGVWQLEVVAMAMSMAHEDVQTKDRVVFVINHLCKPDFVLDGGDFESWTSAIKAMAQCQRTYMKLSGAFNELPDGLSTVEEIAQHMKPWIRHVLDCFKAERVMFGSDWPVCNVERRQDSWLAWRDVVQLALEDREYQLNDGTKERIWRGTAKEAYRVE